MKKIHLKAGAGKKRKIIFTGGVLLLAVSALIASMIWNTGQLEDTLDKKTELYVSSITSQLSDNIGNRLETNLNYIAQLADTITRMPHIQSMDEFLIRKSEALGFHTVVEVSADGTVLCGLPPENPQFSSWLQEGVRNLTQPEIISLEGQLILFSVPMSTDGKTDRVLVGIYDSENIENLLYRTDFGTMGQVLILDKDGKVVASGGDTAHLEQQVEEFLSGANEENAALFGDMGAQIEEKRSGIFSFTYAPGESYVLAYTPFCVNDWALVAIVQNDFLNGEAKTYEYISYGIILISAFVFAALILAIVVTFEKNRKALEQLALKDKLTGGMTKQAFQERFLRLLEQNPPGAYTLVFMNVKDFKLVNKNFGLLAGDATLKYIHKILESHLQKEEPFCRSEMDHFFMALKEQTEEGVQRRIQEIRQAIDSFNEYTDVHYTLATSQGAFQITMPDMELTTMEDYARLASTAQKPGEVCAFFRNELLQEMNQMHLLSSLFQDSLKEREFQVYLQPKVSLRDGRLCSAEALVRWVHHEYGMIFPSDFIPMLEANGNICTLDLYVFEEVCRLLKSWMEEGKELISVSVNLSRQHIRNLNFLRSFVEVKEKYGIPDGVIELELTESVIFNHDQIQLMKEVIRRMHESGFLCSMDDFGVEYSSIALLKEFDVDVVKMDKRFFKDDLDQKSRYVIEGIIDIVHKLDIHVVAEGIETPELLDYLRNAGCDMVQGYIFSKPLPIGEFELWRENHGTEVKNKKRKETDAANGERTAEMEDLL